MHGVNEEEILKFIEETFEENYEFLRADGGHSLAPHIRKQALEQVKLYWKKLRTLAENVTETEVPLTLPLQKTPKGRTYTIQGVVDVVREGDTTILYDIKTHDVDYVRQNRMEYEGQLNIYAHIWQNIRGQMLDGTCIVATGHTEKIRQAYQKRDPKAIEKAVQEWEPEVPVETNPQKVKETIYAFGEVVDLIEENCFSPPPLEQLESKIRGNKTFAVHVCRNCDARFSCDSYRHYAFARTGAKKDILAYYEDYGTELERNEMLDANLSDGE